MQTQKIGRSLMQVKAYFNAWNARDPEAATMQPYLSGPAQMAG